MNEAALPGPVQVVDVRMKRVPGRPLRGIGKVGFWIEPHAEAHRLELARRAALGISAQPVLAGTDEGEPFLSGEPLAAFLLKGNLREQEIKT